MKKLKGKGVVLYVLLILFLTICIFNAYKYYRWNSNKLDKEMISLITLKEDNKINDESINNQKLEINNNVLNEEEHSLDYYRNYYQNNDIKGILKIDGTKINTLLVQTTNNTYYLNHSLYRKKNSRGANFIDYRTPLNFQQVNIYGHNARKPIFMFKDLEKYVNKNFYDKHKYIRIWDGDKENIYQIASVQIDKESHEHMIVNPVNKKDHIDKLSQSLYKTGVDINENDDLVIIQTCFYNPPNSFLIIVSKKIN